MGLLSLHVRIGVVADCMTDGIGEVMVVGDAKCMLWSVCLYTVRSQWGMERLGKICIIMVGLVHSMSDVPDAPSPQQ